jgi:hypothetical protein
MNSWLPRAFLVGSVVLLVVIALSVGYCCWRNSRSIARSKDEIREALNKILKARKVDPVMAVDLTTASRVFGVPLQLEFEHHLFRTDDLVGRRPVGLLTGTFNRKTGEIVVDLQFFDGKREYGLRDMLKPVP